MIENYLESLKKLYFKVGEIDRNISTERESELIKVIKEKFNLPALSFFRLYPSFERLTINRLVPPFENSRIKRIRYLLNPPSHYVENLGRANLRHQSIFYATFLAPTAINELKPEPGDLFTISKWKLIDKNTQLHVYPIFEKQKTDLYKKLKSAGIVKYDEGAELSILYEGVLKDKSEEERKMIYGIQKFVSKCFSLEVNDSNTSRYLFTAAIADKIFHHNYDGAIEAITYPSIYDSTGVKNIAIKPHILHQKYRLDSVREYELIANPSGEPVSYHNGYTSKFIGGNIIWE